MLETLRRIIIKHTQIFLIPEKFIILSVKNTYPKRYL